MSKNIGEILKTLIKSHDINTMVLARDTGIGQSVISRLISGETFDPRTSTLKTLSRYFNITINQLLGEIPLKVDTTMTDRIPKTLHVPIISWEEIAMWSHLDTKEKQKIILSDITSKGNVYAVYMNDDSMYPVFSKNMLLIFDFDKPPVDGSYVMVKHRTQAKPEFRQLIKEQNICYLRALSPDSTKYKVRMFTSKDKHMGTLIQVQKNFN